MAMERSEYPAMLAGLSPDQAVGALNDRVRQVGRLNTEIADWLQERRRLEELYSNGLRKLARKNINGADLGVFSVPWSTLTSSAETLAESHSALASKIEVDVERPLRDFVGGNREMQAMSNMQGNLSAIAKDVDRAGQKVEKAVSKGGDLGKAQSELEQTQGQWDSQAPYVFESLQSIDETRWNHLRDVLTQFQTHEVDQVEKHRVSAEQVLNVLLNVETADEIKTFALKTVENKQNIERPSRTPTAAAALGSSSSTPQRSADVGSALSPSMSQTDDGASRHSGAPEEKKKGFSKLKRLGTVMGRKRESKLPQQLQPMSESPERKPKASPFNSFTGRLGRSKDTPSLAPPSEDAERGRPSSPLRAGSEILEPPTERAASPSPFESRHKSGVNGVAAGAAGAAGLAGAGAAAAVASNIPNGSHQGDLADLEPPKPAEPESQPVQSKVEEPVRDSEGYSMPSRELDPITQAQQDAAAENLPPQFNVNIRDAPVEERGADADAALASMASKLQMQAPTQNPRRLGTVRGRREARNSFVPPPANQQSSDFASSPSALSPQTTGTFPTVPETSPSTGVFPDAAPTSPPTATAFPEPVPVSAPTAPTPSAAGTPAPLATEQRDIASPLQPSSTGGAFSPGAVAASTFSPFPSAEPTSPLRPASRTAHLGTDHTNDNQSIRSGRSLTSTGSQGHRHPELHDMGLNSSIVETISARFQDGQLSSSSLVGEIALAYNAADFSSPFGTDNIRLENFSSLEKVAPNPAFINPIAGKEGEYSVNLASVQKTQVAFKYQIHATETGAHAPLLISPAFKIEPTQASIIVSYSLNPAFTLPTGRTSLTMSNVMLGLTLEGAKATSCLSKPVGTFARDRNLIFWQLGDVTLTPGAAPTKLLARFATESEAKSGSVEARWEISGEHANGLGSALAVSVQSAGGASEGADPFADEDASGLVAAWKEVKSVRKMVAGNYVAK